jgi:peroxiredoxin
VAERAGLDGGPPVDYLTLGAREFSGPKNRKQGVAVMIEVGDRLPEGSFRVKQDDDSMKQVPTGDYFKGQKVVFVGVPGAFTSTCHVAHIPQFVTNVAAIKAKGVDRIVVMAVNDHHVMKSWSEALGGKGKLDFVADGDADYAKALGLSVQIPGMGTRVRRFSMLVEDGVVKTLNFEPEGGKGIQATGAATILGQL